MDIPVILHTSQCKTPCTAPDIHNTLRMFCKHYLECFIKGIITVKMVEGKPALLHLRL